MLLAGLEKAANKIDIEVNIDILINYEKTKHTVYQRVQLDGVWYVIIQEEEFSRHAAGTRACGEEGRTGCYGRQRVRAGGLAAAAATGMPFDVKDLARLAGVRVETLNRIEKGRTTPDFGTIRKLVNAIKCP